MTKRSQNSQVLEVDPGPLEQTQSEHSQKLEVKEIQKIERKNKAKNGNHGVLGKRAKKLKDEKSQMILEQFQKNHAKMIRDTDAQK